MRARVTTAIIAASLCATVLHCGGGDDSGAGPVADGGGSDVATSSDTGGPTDAGDSGTVFTRVDVSGVLIENLSPYPAVSGRDVVVVGADDVVTQIQTDGTGAFHVAGVAVPYDVAVPGISADGGENQSRFYGGISRPDITVYTTFMPPSATTYSADVTFTMTAVAGDKIYVATPIHSASANVADGASHAYSLPFTWFSSTNDSEPIHVIVIHSDGTVASYADFAAQSFTNAGTVALGTITPTAVAAASITTHWVVPSGYTFGTQNEQFAYADNTVISPSLAAFELATADGTFPAPAIPNLSLVLFGGGAGPSTDETGGTVYGVPVSSPPVTYTLLPVPTQTAPANNAVGVDSAADTLSFVPMSASGFSELDLGGTEGTTRILTSGSTFALSRLVAAKIGLKSGESYTWFIGGGNLTVDELVTHTTPPNFLEPAGTMDFEGSGAPPFTFQTK